nr:class 1 isoprenoid biosynthesis enzyme [Paenibacillus hamazuiensis]
MLGGESPFIREIAALTELLILTLDIVDDVQDRDNMEKPWMRCPQEQTINAILAFLMGFMGKLGQLVEHSPQTVPMIQETARIVSRAIDGQHKDLLGHCVESEQDYIAVVQEKSGSLIRLACYMGGFDAPQSDAAAIRLMNELADCIGIMAQINNDVKDVQRYDLKNDLLHKKRTLPILYMLAHCDGKFPALKLFYEGNMSTEQFLRHKPECLAFVADSGCIEYCRIIQSLYYNRAEELFSKIPGRSPWKEKFRETTFASYALDS